MLQGYVHVGVAMRQARGLIVPVIRDVPSRDLADIDDALATLHEQVRRGDPPPEDLEGASATLHDHATLGASSFTPAVVWPQVTALGCGAPRAEVQAVDGAPAIVQRLPLSLAVDSRDVNPVEATRFMQWIRDTLENPMSAWLPA